MPSWADKHSIRGRQCCGQFTADAFFTRPSMLPRSPFNRIVDIQMDHAVAGDSHVCGFCIEIKF